MYSLLGWLNFSLYSLNYSWLLMLDLFFFLTAFKEIKPPVGDNLLHFPGIFVFTLSYGFSD